MADRANERGRIFKRFGVEEVPDASCGTILAFAPESPAYEWEGITVIAYKLDEQERHAQTYFAEMREFSQGLLANVLGVMGRPRRDWVALFAQLPPGSYELVLNGPVRKLAGAMVYPGRIVQVTFAS